MFSLLPLATVIDNKVLIVHGGISDKTDLDFLSTVERHNVGVFLSFHIIQLFQFEIYNSHAFVYLFVFLSTVVRHKLGLLFIGEACFRSLFIEDKILSV